MTSGVGEGCEPTTIFRSPYAPAHASHVACPDGSRTPHRAVISSSSGTPPGPTKIQSSPAASFSLICSGSSASRSIASTTSGGGSSAASHCRHRIVSSEPQCLRPSADRGRPRGCAAANGSLASNRACAARQDGRLGCWGTPPAARVSAAARACAAAASSVWASSGGGPAYTSGGEAATASGAWRTRARAPPTWTAGGPEARRADTSDASGPEDGPGTGHPSEAGGPACLSGPDDGPGSGGPWGSGGGSYGATCRWSLRCFPWFLAASERRGRASRRMRSNSLSRIHRLLLCGPDGQRMPRSHATSPDVLNASPVAGTKEK